MTTKGWRRIVSGTRGALLLAWLSLGVACGGRSSDSQGPMASAPDLVDALPSEETCADNPYVSPCRETQPSGLFPGEETCAENPYLVKCQPPTNWDQATQLLRRECGDCHGYYPGDPEVIGEPFPLTEEGLEESGLIVRCAAEQSRLIQVLRDGSMPVTSRGYEPFTEQMIDALAALIDDGCGL